MESKPVKMVVASKEFFDTPLKKIAVETNEGTGRVYFLKGGRIVAVAVPSEGRI